MSDQDDVFNWNRKQIRICDKFCWINNLLCNVNLLDRLECSGDGGCGDSTESW